MSKEESNNKDPMNHYIWAAAVCVVLVLAVYAWRFYGRSMGGAAEFGAFGDFVGGVINPLLGFVTIWLLVKSLQFQRDEVGATRDELALSNKIFESQMTLQRRQNLREQLKGEFQERLDDFSFLYAHVQHTESGRAINLKDVIRAGRMIEKGDNQPVWVELYTETGRWDQADYSILADKLRRSFAQLIICAKTLVYYMDSSVLVDALFMTLKQEFESVRLLKLYEPLVLQQLKSGVISAVEKREQLGFPEFERTSARLHIDDL